MDIFTVSAIRPIRDYMTISRDAHLGITNKVTWFSMGKNTSISQECYDHSTIYMVNDGEGVFVIGMGGDKVTANKGDIVFIEPGTLLGVETRSGVVFTEIINLEAIKMTEKIVPGEIFALKNLIDYEDGSISNLDLASNATFKYVLMAFDEGTGLTPHRAPGNAVVFALEGKAIIGYEGLDYEIHEGQCFRFEKNGLHSVTAKGRFKMALLLVIE